jgi:hypothetical protein
MYVAIGGVHTLGMTAYSASNPTQSCRSYPSSRIEFPETLNWWLDSQHLPPTARECVTSLFD